jgi:hypothetical protein
MARKTGQNFQGGVVFVHSAVDTGGGDIVGRDKHQAALAGQIENVFQPVADALDRVDSKTAASAKEKLQTLKEEAGKGKSANDSIIAKLIEGIVGLVPAAVGAVVSAFATPVLGGVAGPVTKYVLDRIQGK